MNYYVDQKLRDRLLANINITPGGCWLWMGQCTAKGYGRMHIGRRRMVMAHRASYEIFFGPFDGRLLVCHRCDNPPCVNPKHLFLGTPADNMRDAARKGRLSSKLHIADIVVIATRYEAGEDHRDLAEEYGVSVGTIKGVLLGKTWKHVERRLITPRADLAHIEQRSRRRPSECEPSAAI